MTFKRDLMGLPPQFTIDSPEESNARAFRAVRGVVAEQGQVMSAALDNNKALWETNKKLRREHKEMMARVQTLDAENAALRRDLERLSTPESRNIVELRETCEELSRANDALRQELTAQNFPEYDTDARHAALQEMQRQRAELDATGLVPSDAEINEWDDEEIAAAKLAKETKEDGEQNPG